MADEMSDIYSIGVIMFQLITKLFPYVNQANVQYMEFRVLLKKSNIVRPKFYSTYSLKLQKLFEYVVKMCAKSKKQRIPCKDLYDYLDNEEVFAPYREKKVEPSVEIQLPSLPMKIN